MPRPPVVEGLEEPVRLRVADDGFGPGVPYQFSFLPNFCAMKPRGPGVMDRRAVSAGQMHVLPVWMPSRKPYPWSLDW
jgi:hypothetical protein